MKTIKASAYSYRFLLSMYTSLKTHVEWNGIHFRFFCVRNGVK